MPVVIEKKKLLNGITHQYECERILYTRNFGILKYVLDMPFQVARLVLPQNTVTMAFYWCDRPYTLYRWYFQQHNIGNYFNIADRIVLQETEFRWRDLVVDILIYQNRELEILDWEELPAEIPVDLYSYILSATEQVKSNYLSTIKETDEILKALPRF